MSVKQKALMSFIWVISVLIMWLSLSLSTAWAQDENVAKAQRVLSALGYDPGKADGVMGPRTRRAIAAYQHSNNLPPTSELDEPTLRALGLLAVPLEPEIPPAPTPPPAAWRTVLAYLQHYDSQPSRLVPYLTEHFRQGLQAQAWIRKTMNEIAAQNFSRLSWRIERVEPPEPEAASEATVEVYSRVRISGEEMARREVFSLVRADHTTWLINELTSLAVSESGPEALTPDETTAGR
ncbi:MAG: hypothetical protein ETSY2_39005 [Candidatus Entotheonella gemina]|uniref:Peptidoglycan binding-like domain-containing protein n=2 Tax=Candidatus Entotheonella TaxID=93171 RepID=W4LQX3_9BACT|nr:MAG: hypothetical protein ETSY2_39005 [Candidatus Entotheonella gemina]